MDNIKHGKLIVSNSLNELNYAKQYGEANLKNNYLLLIINDLLNNLNEVTFEQQQCLNTLYNYILYNNVRNRK